MVAELTLSRPLPPVEGLPFPVPASSNWMKIRAHEGILFWRVKVAVAATTACRVLPDRWFIPHFAVYAEFSAWDATVDRARVYSPLYHGFYGVVKLRRTLLVLISLLVALPFESL